MIRASWDDRESVLATTGVDVGGGRGRALTLRRAACAPVATFGRLQNASADAASARWLK